MLSYRLIKVYSTMTLLIVVVALLVADHNIFS